MNSIILKGRLTADPELKTVNEEQKVCNFTIAVPRSVNREITDFFNACAWGVKAEIISKYFVKGQEILVRGSMQSNKYEYQGQKRTNWVVVVDELDFCGSKSDNDSLKGNVNTETKAKPENKSSQNKGGLWDMDNMGSRNTDFSDIDILEDDDLPF